LTKTIDTLVEDIYSVVDGQGGWTETVNKHMGERLMTTMMARLNPEPRAGGTLRMSNLGTPCERKLWYSVNSEGDPVPLLPSTKFKFLYGDILEDLLISLAEAAGHEVTGFQTTMDIQGIKGHRDCVIDGVTVDVKSASTYSFQKFQQHNLRNDDPFGYIEQLSSYVYSGKDDPLVRDKTHGAFLAVDKQHGHICLDMYDFTDEINQKEGRVKYLKEMVKDTTPPTRGFDPEPDGKSGNMSLALNCSYCEFKKVCYPEVRGFIVGGKPKYLTTVKKEPWSSKYGPCKEFEV